MDTTLTGLSSSAANASGLASTAFGLGAQVALRCITAADVGLDTQTGWSITNSAGNYGIDYLLRARESRASNCYCLHSCMRYISAVLIALQVLYAAPPPVSLLSAFRSTTHK